MNEADEQQTVEQPAEAEPRPTPGMLLRQARQAQQLSIAEVATRLKLRRQLVEQLENDEFGPAVEGTFVRGYLRAYAKLLQLPTTEIIAAYEALGVAERPVEQMQSFSRKTSMASQDSKLMLLTWVIVAIFVTSALVFGWQKLQESDVNGVGSVGNGVPEAESPTTASSANDDDPTTTDNAADTTTDRIEPSATEAPATSDDSALTDAELVTDISVAELTAVLESPLEEPSAAEAAAVVADAMADLDDMDSAAEPELSAPEAASETTRDSTDTAGSTDTESDTDPTTTTPAVASVSDTGAEPDTAAELPDAELVLRFTDDSWIRVEDASGTTLAYGVQSGGEELALDGVAPYELILGSPGSVTIYYAGEAVDMSEFRQSRSSRVTIPEQD